MNKDTEGSKKRKYGRKEDAVDERIDIRREMLGIRTRNVLSLNGTGKLEEVENEMKRCGLNVLGVSEVRRKEHDDYMSEEDGVRKITRRGKAKGVGIILDEETTRRVVE